MGDNLRAKGLARHAGNVQQLLQGRGQAPDAFLDDAFNPRGQDLPVELRRFDPFAVGIADDVSPRLQTVQQFDGEKGMAGSLPVERIAKGTIQPIGFAIDERIHKGAAVGLVQPHVDLAKAALQLVDQRFQRMSFAAATQGDFRRPVDANQQDALLPGDDDSDGRAG